MLHPKTRIGLVLICLILALVSLTACGGSNNNNQTNNNAASVVPTDTPAATATGMPVVTTPAKTTTKAAGTTNTTKAAGATTKSSKGTDTSASSGDLSLTGQYPEKTVVRSFTDSQGDTVRLLYGRGTGHGGDYGWAHIYGKHFKGIWYDGGTVTTYPQAFGSDSPDQVVSLINQSLQDKTPDDAGNGRYSYIYAVSGTNYDVFTVVGNDGVIITAYPVKHGSKGGD